MKEYKLVLTISGPPMSGKTHILNLIEGFLKEKGIECEYHVGKNIETEHQLIIKNRIEK